jgi:HEPN domain-containing protein
VPEVNTCSDEIGVIAGSNLFCHCESRFIGTKQSPDEAIPIKLYVIITTMRKESSRLWEQAEEDLDTAEKLLDVGKYYASVFFSEQAAEKALKVMYLEKKRRVAFTHDLVELAEELGVPEDVSHAAAELSPDYIMTRYPDAANAVPAKLYNASSAEMHLNLSREVIRWVKRALRLET